MTLSLQGQVAFITGGGSGLGAAAARRLAADGAIVAINDLSLEAAKKVADELGGLAFAFDVTDSTAFQNAVDTCVAQLGRLDIMINNAGIAPQDAASKMDLVMDNMGKRMAGNISDMAPTNYLLDLSDENWDRMIKVHLYGTFYGSRAAARHMTPQRSGSIINISSVLGLRPTAMAPHYSTAKAAIIALTKSQSQELAPLGVRVNAVCPGYIDTPLLAPMNDLMKVAIVSQIGVGRLGTDDEIAEMVSFIASPKASYCTGEVFSVTGGYSG